MQVRGLCWVGTRTQNFDATVKFFEEVLGLVRLHKSDFAVLELGDGATVEIFGPESDYNAHLTTPVAGFAVDDLAAAEQELVANQIEIVLPITGGEERIWLHFRSPDGHVYELVEDRVRR